MARRRKIRSGWVAGFDDVEQERGRAPRDSVKRELRLDLDRDRGGGAHRERDAAGLVGTDVGRSRLTRRPPSTSRNNDTCPSCSLGLE
ncbi:hypothetical protein PR202_ga30347 [Eleusine coracana subsp. coracana]|uniref:Uncharacterized protein n=1 Tax=Eleusine coracana subsp. coracana TaxID=191504 RepID=A0AAV5DQD9_ELECO|nr:hypothetical protein PR202_ga30347 [Eleusine coracana subsp. coracana]